MSSAHVHRNVTTPIQFLKTAPRWAVLLLCAWCLGTQYSVLKTWPFSMLSGMQDFTTFYIGAKLSGTPALYHATAQAEMQAKIMYVDERFPYSRLPVFAFAMRPFAALPYFPALIIWKLLSLSAIIATAFVLPVPRRLSALALCASVPLWSAFLLGQDMPFLLLAVALALRFYLVEKPVWTGVCLGLAALAKPHLFLFLFLLFVLRREWRVIAAAITVGLIAVALCFALQGRGWVTDYVRIITAKPMAEHWNMPNLGGFFASGGVNEKVYYWLLPIPAVLTALFAWRTSFPLAFSAVTLVTLVFGIHGYTYDYALLIPPFLLVADVFPAAVCFWLSPVPYIGLHAWPMFPGRIIVFMAAAVTIRALYEDNGGCTRGLSSCAQVTQPGTVAR